MYGRIQRSLLGHVYREKAVKLQRTASAETRRTFRVGGGLLAVTAALLVFAVVMAGCGGSTSSTTLAPTSSPTATGSSTSAAPSAGTTASGARITFALVTPLSAPGDYRSGQDIQKMAEVWVQQVNASGGIQGHPVDLAVYDDQGKPEVGASAVERAITEKKAVAILGLWHSSVTVAEMEVVKRYNVPMLAFYSWADDVTKKNYPQVFRIGPYNSLIAIRTADYFRSKGYKNVAALVEDTAYGIGFGDALKAAVKPGDFKLNVVQFQAQTQDLTAELSKIQADSPDALVIVSVYAAQNIGINQARELGFKGDIIAGAGLISSDFWPTVGKNGIGVIYTDFFDNSLGLTTEGQRAQTLYKQKNSKDPVIYQYFLWDTMNAVKNAIESKGSYQPADIIATLPNVTFEGTTNNKISFTNQAGTLHFHQWEGLAMFFKKLTALNQPVEQSELVFTSK